MKYELDACIVKELGSRRIFLRSLLPPGACTELFLIQIQQAVEGLLGPFDFFVLRYPAGVEAREVGGFYTVYRTPQPSGRDLYTVRQGQEVFAVFQTAYLTESALSSLLSDAPYEVCPVRSATIPEGFPDASKHPSLEA